MRLENTSLEGLYILHRSIHHDARGYFTRLFGVDEIANAGRPTQALHVNSSTSLDKGTLRGIHFQYPPHAETKVVSCISGAVWDVGVDLRPNSPTRFHWFGTILTPENGTSLIIPEGFGHAFITLEANTTVVYVVSAYYSLQHEAGVRYDDAKLNINWPITPNVISKKDISWGSIESRMSEFDKGFEELN
jgi:dTDP-4-dehydrorhamnose 3,5-epimerase